VVSFPLQLAVELLTPKMLTENSYQLLLGMGGGNSPGFYALVTEVFSFNKLRSFFLKGSLRIISHRIRMHSMRRGEIAMLIAGGGGITFP
jgi:hypothetical protein